MPQEPSPQQPMTSQPQNGPSDDATRVSESDADGPRGYGGGDDASGNGGGGESSGLSGRWDMAAVRADGSTMNRGPSDDGAGVAGSYEGTSQANNGGVGGGDGGEKEDGDLKNYL